MHQQATATAGSFSVTDTPASSAAPTGTRAAGIAIAAATILSTIFVALDQGASGDTPLALLRSMVAMQAMKQLVHGVAIASVLAYAFGYASLAQRLGLRRPLVLAGLSAYLIGCVAMVAATVLDGFVTGDAAALFSAASSPDGVKQGYNMIMFMGVVLTDLARVGWVIQAVAAVGWSLVMLGGRGWQFGVGLVGLLSGLLVVVAVFVAGANMDMAAILSILLAQAVWNLAAAAWLVRRKDY